MNGFHVGVNTVHFFWGGCTFLGVGVVPLRGMGVVHFLGMGVVPLRGMHAVHFLGMDVVRLRGWMLCVFGGIAFVGGHPVPESSRWYEGTLCPKAVAHGVSSYLIAHGVSSYSIAHGVSSYSIAHGASSYHIAHPTLEKRPIRRRRRNLRR